MSGTATLSAAAADSMQSAEVSQEEFLQHMTAMQQHYRAVDPAAAQVISPYLLPAHLILAVPRAPSGAGTTPAGQAIPQSHETSTPGDAARQVNLTFAHLVAIGAPAQASQLMADALHDQQQESLASINVHQDAMLQAIATAQGSKSTQTFVQQMDAVRDRIKTDHDARIDAMFARFAAIGTAHPAARPIILGTGNKVGNFVASLAAGAASVAGAVKSAVAVGEAAIGKAAEAVGKWASGATQSIGHFFGGLF